MASANLIFQRVSDEVARLATITVDSGTPNTDPNYGPATLVDENPAKFAKIDSTSGSFLFAFAAKQIVALIALIHHCFDAGANVKIQGNNTNVWTSPAFVAAFTIPAWLGSGTGRWPMNAWLDLTTVTPVSGSYDPTGFFYWRLLVTSNSQNIQLGQVWMGAQIRRLTPNVDWGPTSTFDTLSIKNATSYGVSTVFSRRTYRWGQTAKWTPSLDAITDLNQQWYDVGGDVHPFLIVPDGRVNDPRLVRWASGQMAFDAAPGGMINRGVLSLAFQEVARGLRPGV